jgi:hypothetical protein
MNIGNLSLSDIISFETVIPFISTLIILIIYILNKRTKLLIYTTLILHLLFIILKTLSFISEIMYRESYLSEYSPSALYDLIIKIYDIQTINLFVYMIFVIFSILLLSLRVLKERG